MKPGSLERLNRINPKTAGMWAKGWLVADDQPVARVLLELNRYLRQPVRFDAQELAAIRVSGSFPLADPDRALGGILQSTGLRMSSTTDDAPRVSRAK
jgi:transmembrane sensor